MHQNNKPRGGLPPSTRPVAELARGVCRCWVLMEWGLHQARQAHHGHSPHPHLIQPHSLLKRPTMQNRAEEEEPPTPLSSIRQKGQP